MSPRPAVLGLDVGGANLKAAHSDGSAHLEPFELWKYPGELPAALGRLVQRMPAAVAVAVTMTGELCDCFETRRQGVLAILDAVEAAVASLPIQVWTLSGRFVDVPAARTDALQAAAANWLALATFAGRFAPRGAGVLLDIGSTTTDVIPLQEGRPVPHGRTDPERLRSRELIYTGVRRTPVTSLLGPAVAAELFATMLDVYLVLRDRPEEPADRGTADGRPAVRSAAVARLARMLCADVETYDAEEVRRLAEDARRRQVFLIADAVNRVAGGLTGAPRTLILAGSGEFLAGRVLARLTAWPAFGVVSLAERLGPAVSSCACAHAVAVLAAEARNDHT